MTMNYKGREIPDRLVVPQHQEIEKRFNVDSFLATPEDLEHYRKLLLRKKEELDSRACTIDGVRVVDIFLEVSCYEAQPEGDYTDYEPVVEVGFAWNESESDYEALKRIEKTKKEIDRQLEREEKEILMREVRQATAQEKKIEEAKRLLESSGYRITKN